MRIKLPLDLHDDLAVGPLPAVWPVHKTPCPHELFSSPGEKYSNRLHVNN